MFIIKLNYILITYFFKTLFYIEINFFIQKPTKLDCHKLFIMSQFKK